MNYERARRRAKRANDIFLSEFGPIPGTTLPHMAWFWSEELLMPDNVLDMAGDPILDYICSCGINKDIHSPTCTSLSVAHARMHMVKVCNTVDHEWVLCRWQVPNQETWLATYLTLDNYPTGGRYIPLSIGSKLTTLPESSPPSEDDSRLICAMVKADAGEPANVKRDKWQHSLEQRDVGKRAVLRDAIRDVLPSFGQRPGEKGHVSFATPQKEVTL
jgi:hypothetical protein